MKFDETPDIYSQPAYRVREAAQILALPQGTVQAWCFGHDYRHRKDGSRKRFLRVIEPSDPRTKLLSFVNLCGCTSSQRFAGIMA